MFHYLAILIAVCPEVLWNDYILAYMQNPNGYGPGKPHPVDPTLRDARQVGEGDGACTQLTDFQFSLNFNCL